MVFDVVVKQIINSYIINFISVISFFKLNGIMLNGKINGWILIPLAISTSAIIGLLFHFVKITWNINL